MKALEPEELHVMELTVTDSEQQILFTDLECEVADFLVRQGYGYWGNSLPDWSIPFHLTDKGHLAYRVHKAFLATL